MYLTQGGTAPINNRKWNLGHMRSWRTLRGMGMQPVRLRGLGDEVVDPTSSDLLYAIPNDIWNTPVIPASQNPSPVVGGASNANITTVPAGQPSQDPLDYTSPQAAIAAGLDPTKTYAAWTNAMQRFSSPQAAISAGVPAGVVNQLWQQAQNNAASNVPGFFSTTTGMLVAVGAGVVGLSLLAGGRRR